MKKHLPLLIVVLVVLGTWACAAHAGGFANTTSLAVGANGIWLDGTTQVQDVEGCANGAMSLSPHISAVGSVNYGFVNAYWRSTVGGRITATDVNDPNFSVGVGIQYHSSNATILPANEWCPDVSVGLRPWPLKFPALTLTGLGWYGLDSGLPGADIGLRYRFNL